MTNSNSSTPLGDNNKDRHSRKVTGKKGYLTDKQWHSTVGDQWSPSWDTSPTGGDDPRWMTPVVPEDSPAVQTCRSNTSAIAATPATDSSPTPFFSLMLRKVMGVTCCDSM